MNKYLKTISICITILFSILYLISCAPQNNEYNLNMNTDYADCKQLQDGGNADAKVILLLGQSNASGFSLTEYLQLNTSEEEFQKYQTGFENILINYCIDDQSYTSGGEFVKVDLTCGSGNGFFGPEVGMAEVLNENVNDEKIFILKYTMSGYSLNYHWLYNRNRASIYNACMQFIEKYMDCLVANNYNAKISAICWMQGESDTTIQKAERYYDNQIAFVNYLREDLAKYSDTKGIYLVDAGISNNLYCEPGYPIVNEAKENFAKLSDLNIYFSTIDMGLTTNLEPDYDPDLGHYDSLCEIALGRRFGEEILKIIS